jgi:regulatory protein
MNEWGRVKIKAALKQKQISDYCINKAMKQIEEKEYLQLLKKLAEKRYASLKNEQYLIRKRKTMDYLLQKGFEWELVKETVGK